MTSTINGEKSKGENANKNKLYFPKKVVDAKGVIWYYSQVASAEPEGIQKALLKRKQKRFQKSIDRLQKV